MFERNPPQLCHHDNRDTVGSHCCETALDMQMLKKHASLSVLISQSLSTPQSQLWILCSAFSKLSLDFILKKQFTQNCTFGPIQFKFGHYLLTPMPMECRLEFQSTENISEASQQESILNINNQIKQNGTQGPTVPFKSIKPNPISKE